jgi:hypothetical protein
LKQKQAKQSRIFQAHFKDKDIEENMEKNICCLTLKNFKE